MAADTKQFIIASLNQDLYGVDIKYIDNIIVMQGIARVPKSQSYIPGVINLRGEIIPVMSLRARLGMEEAPYTNKSRIIIVRPEEQAAPIGLIVDEVREVITLEASAIEQLAYDEKDPLTNFSLGVGKTANELVNLLNIPSVIIEKEASA